MSLTINYNKELTSDAGDNIILTFMIVYTNTAGVKEDHLCKFSICKDYIIHKYYEPDSAYLDTEKKEYYLFNWINEIWFSLRTQNICYFFDSIFVYYVCHDDNSIITYDVQTQDFILKIKYSTPNPVQIHNLINPQLISFSKIPLCITHPAV